MCTKHPGEINARTGRRVATIRHKGVLSGTWQANARLIAAAPELLAFARRFEQMDRGRLSYGPLLYNEARNVLAKATGE